MLLIFGSIQDCMLLWRHLSLLIWIDLIHSSDITLIPIDIWKILGKVQCHDIMTTLHVFVNVSIATCIEITLCMFTFLKKIIWWDLMTFNVHLQSITKSKNVSSWVLRCWDAVAFRTVAPKYIYLHCRSSDWYAAIQKNWFGAGSMIGPQHLLSFTHNWTAIN